jgi:hypothetical protein
MVARRHENNPDNDSGVGGIEFELVLPPPPASCLGRTYYLVEHRI